MGRERFGVPAKTLFARNGSRRAGLRLLGGAAALLVAVLGLGLASAPAGAQSPSATYDRFDIVVERRADGTYRVTEAQVVRHPAGRSTAASARSPWRGSRRSGTCGSANSASGRARDRCVSVRSTVASVGRSTHSWRR